MIGDCPPRSILNPLSGSLYDYIEIKKYSRPCEFLDYVKAEGLRVVSAEISQDSTPLDVFTFDYSSRLVLVVGQEYSGVPIEILRNSEQVYIPMPGPGFCLNTSQAANIMLYEAVKQYETKVKEKNQTASR